MTCPSNIAVRRRRGGGNWALRPVLDTERRLRHSRMTLPQASHGRPPDDHIGRMDCFEEACVPALHVVHRVPPCAQPRSQPDDAEALWSRNSRTLILQPPYETQQYGYRSIVDAELAYVDTADYQSAIHADSFLASRGERLPSDMRSPLSCRLLARGVIGEQLGVSDRPTPTIGPKPCSRYGLCRSSSRIHPPTTPGGSIRKSSRVRARLAKAFFRQGRFGRVVRQGRFGRVPTRARRVSRATSAVASRFRSREPPPECRGPLPLSRATSA